MVLLQEPSASITDVRYTWDITYNKFYCANYNTSPITLYNQVSPSIIGNIITYTGNTNTGAGIILNSTGQNCGTATIRLNKYINPSPNGGSAIVVGNETTGASDDAYTGSIIEYNYCSLSKMYSDTSNSIHGIFITRNAGCKVNFNVVKGSSIGIVFKATGQDNAAAECHHNIIIDCQTTLCSKGYRNTKFYNNVCVMLLEDGRYHL